jgi:hypothetical protein
MINSISSVGHNQATVRTEQRRVNLPSFMLSTTKPKMSDEEFEKKIIELAKRNQAMGKFQCKDPNGEFHTLRFSYISVASPDREGMINKALPTILGKIREYANKTPNASYEEMIMYLLFGIEPPSSASNSGQQTVLFELYDAHGNNIATLTTGGWHQYATPAENGRSSEFVAIYNKAWDTARHESIYGTPESRRGDGWAMESTPPNITTVDVTEIQPQQGQTARNTTARYEANLHGA